LLRQGRPHRQGDGRNRDSVPAKARQRLAPQIAHEPLHCGRGSDKGDDDTQQRSRHAVVVHQLVTILGQVENGCCRECRKSEEEAVLERRRQRQTHEQRSGDRHETATDTRPQRQCLGESNDRRIRRRHVDQRCVTGSGFPEQQEHTADDPRDDDWPGREQLVLDRITEGRPQRRGGNERRDQQAEHSPPIRIPTRNTPQHRADAPAVQQEYGEYGPDLNGDCVGVGCIATGRVAEAQPTLHHHEMPRRRHG